MRSIKFLGHLESVEVLIKHGANVNAEDYEQWTPIHRAAEDGNSKRFCGFIIFMFFFIKIADHTDVAEVLIRNGANVNAKAIYNYVPLHKAAEFGKKLKLYNINRFIH